MIKTTYKTDTADLDARFLVETGYHLAGFDWQEQDSYTGALTLYDGEELEGGSTILWVNEADCCVTAYDDDGQELEWEAFPRLDKALGAYERMAVEHGTNATCIVM